MNLKGLTDEDFVNYKLPSMYIATATCSFKCDIECGYKICQNSDLVKQPTYNVSNTEIVRRYIANPITKAIVFGGLEPFEQFQEMISLIKNFRDSGVKDDIVIYTGYNKDELENSSWDSYLVDHARKEMFWGKVGKLNCIKVLQSFPNIVVKYGRYHPDEQPHFDPVLGIYLASNNQYAERLDTK